MALDLMQEQAIPITDVPRYVPRRRGKKVHYSTVHRWATKGARGRKLETVLSGGIRYTTIEAVGRFIAFTPQAADEPIVDLGDAIDAALREAGV